MFTRGQITVIIGVFVLSLLATLSNYRRPCLDPERKGNYQIDSVYSDSLTNEDHKAQLRMADYSKYGMVSSLMLGALAIAISLYTFWAGHRQSQEVLRAYIHIEELKVEGQQALTDIVLNANYFLAPWHSNPPQELVYSVPFKNFGQTPAKIVSAGCNAYVGAYPHVSEKELPIDKELLKEHEARNPVYALGPTGTNILVTGLDHKLDDKQILGLRERRLAIWIFGHIEYYDKFSRKKRVTRFRVAHYLPNGKKEYGQDFLHHYEGNDAT